MECERKRKRAKEREKNEGSAPLSERLEQARSVPVYRVSNLK